MDEPQIQVVKGNIPICIQGKAPYWCQKEQVLYFVDIFKSRVLRYNPSNGFCNYLTVSLNCLISPWGQFWERVLHKHKCIQITAQVPKGMRIHTNFNKRLFVWYLILNQSE